MRTTLIIPDPVCKRAKEFARRNNRTLSEVVSEAVETRLCREENAVREVREQYRVSPVSMGAPAVDLSDRDALNRIMDGEA